MLKDARIVTSKFLQLRDNLNDAMKQNAYTNYNSPAIGLGVNKTSCDIHALQSAFGELCKLLHELVVEENN